MHSNVRGYILCVRRSPRHPAGWQMHTYGTVGVALLREWFGEVAVSGGRVTLPPDDRAIAAVSAFVGFPVTISALLRSRRSLTLVIQEAP